MSTHPAGSPQPVGCHQLNKPARQQLHSTDYLTVFSASPTSNVVGSIRLREIQRARRVVYLILSVVGFFFPSETRQGFQYGRKRFALCPSKQRSLGSLVFATTPQVTHYLAPLSIDETKLDQYRIEASWTRITTTHMGNHRPRSQSTRRPRHKVCASERPKSNLGPLLGIHQLGDTPGELNQWD